MNTSHIKKFRGLLRNFHILNFRLPPFHNVFDHASGPVVKKFWYAAVVALVGSCALYIVFFISFKQKNERYKLVEALLERIFVHIMHVLYDTINL